jgi:5'-methylthioadenosine phosphorylase
MMDAAEATARTLGITPRRRRAYACAESSRLGKQAENGFPHQAGHLLGMANSPEASMARERQIACDTVGIATDYDCWRGDPIQHLCVAAIFECCRRTLVEARRLLKAVLAPPLTELERATGVALAESMLRPGCARRRAARMDGGAAAPRGAAALDL